ncbi:phage tail tape measure protein, partial [bacterium]|nr:phage tail tape measure protein [bacterium]
MAQKFILTAELQLQAPKNVRAVVSDIERQLKDVQVKVDVRGAARASKDLRAAAESTKDLGKEASTAAGGVKKMDLALGKALKQVFRYDIARAVLNTFRRTLEDNVRAAIDFEREMIKVAQVTNQSMSQLKGLTNEISKLSTGLGVSSASLVKTSRILAQTGMTAKDVKVALEALAKTTLAPTFDDIANTTETAIAAMRQFDLQAKDLGRTLGQINAVAGKFAVEASDIGVAIRRAGGAFKSAGGELEELIALFTSVRSTTRETAETIATGFRTIFTRLQRPKTIEFLRKFGIELQDLNGKFVGPYEAVRRLHNALRDLDPRDVRYSMITEQLGGFRQVSKVIPLIQQFGTAQKALNVAQRESGSLTRDAMTAQQALAVQITKLTEDIKELFRTITESKSFQVLVSGALKLADALVKIGDSLAPILPMLATLGAVKIAQFGFGRFFGGGGGGGKQFGGKVNRFSSGGLVPGRGNGDTVPAMLEGGEFVMRKSAVKSIGTSRLAGMNRYATGGVTSMPSAFVRGNILRSQRTTRKDSNWGFRDGITAFNDPNTRGKEDTISGDVRNRSLDIESILRRKRILTPSKSPARKGKYDVREGYKGRLLSYAGSRLNPTAQGAIFEDLLRKSGYLGGDKSQFGGNNPLDGTVKGVLAEVKRSKVSDNTILDKRLRHENNKNSLKGIKLTGGADDIALSGVMQLNDAIGDSASRMSSLRGKLRAAGGAVGTDSVPSLLTPGEFVINKKSAQSIGYGNLYSMNKMQDGGVVAGGGFTEAGTAGGGGLDLTSIIMQFAMLQMTMGAFGDKTKDATDAVGASETATGKFNKHLGAAIKPLGQIAQGSMMIVAKYTVMGSILKQVSEGLFGHSAVMNTLINVTMFAAGALQFFAAAANRAAIVDLFTAIPGLIKSLPDLVGSGIGNLVKLVAGIKAGEIVTKKVAGGLSRAGRAIATPFNAARGWAEGAHGAQLIRQAPGAGAGLRSGARSLGVTK